MKTAIRTVVAPVAAASLALLTTACPMLENEDEDGIDAGSTIACDSPDGGPIALATKQDSAFHIAQDGTHVYWWANATGLNRVHKDGTGLQRLSEKLFTETTIDKADPPVAVDETHAYTIDNGFLWKVPKGGGEPERLDSVGGWPRDMKLDGDYLYLVSGSSMMALPKTSDGSAQAWGQGEMDEALRLAFDESHIYVGTARGMVFRIPKDRSAGPVELARSWHAINGIAVDETHVFWVESAGRMVRADKDGANVVELVAGSSLSAQDRPQYLLVDGDYLYFPLGTYSGWGRILKDGTGEPERYHHNNPYESSRGIAVDETAVYWSTGFSDGAIYRSCR